MTSDAPTAAETDEDRLADICKKTIEWENAGNSDAASSFGELLNIDLSSDARMAQRLAKGSSFATSQPAARFSRSASCMAMLNAEYTGPSRSRRSASRQRRGIKRQVTPLASATSGTSGSSAVTASVGA